MTKLNKLMRTQDEIQAIRDRQARLPVMEQDNFAISLCEQLLDTMRENEILQDSLSHFIAMAGYPNKDTLPCICKDPELWGRRGILSHHPSCANSSKTSEDK